jgi:arginine N-succinyltransferase
MFLIRDANAGDLDGLEEIAAHLNSVNLPDDRERLRSLITASEESFSGRRDVADRRFLFVLCDLATGRLHGCSMIFAQHGSRRAPHVFFDVMEEERYSQTLDRHFVHRILRIGYNYKGLTEIGGLVVRPESRGHPEQLGKLLAHVRFLYMAAHRTIFCDEVLSELMPPLETDGTSLLWEALGRRFTGLSYQEADRLSHENKEFIRALFPEEPIYATLLPRDVQAVIGKVGAETQGVEKMLRRIGFEYANRIDPFDGGPHFQARIDDVTLVRAVRRARVVAAEPSSDGAPPDGVSSVRGGAGRYLVSAEGGAGSPGKEAESGQTDVSRFRAVSVTAVAVGETFPLSEAARQVLRVVVGDEVTVLPIDAATR